MGRFVKNRELEQGALSVEIPQVSTAKRPAGQNGQIIYNTTTSTYQGYISSAWHNISTANSPLGTVTIDKFQGQEARVVLVSMTTSSAEEIGKDVAFLFSKNRLNVAITRAKTLAVVLFNDKLLEFPCKTQEQVHLVNTFCWLHQNFRE